MLFCLHVVSRKWAEGKLDEWRELLGKAWGEPGSREARKEPCAAHLFLFLFLSHVTFAHVYGCVYLAVLIYRHLLHHYTYNACTLLRTVYVLIGPQHPSIEWNALPGALFWPVPSTDFVCLLLRTSAPDTADVMTLTK